MKNTLKNRMADFYFEITDPDGKTLVVESSEAKEDQEEAEEE